MRHLRDELCSVVAIPVTPFGIDGGIDVVCYRRLVQQVVNADVGVVTPNGGTSEVYALSADEQRMAVEAAVQGAGQQALVMAGVGLDLDTAVRMGRSAVEAGARALMVHQPVHAQRSADGWVAYYRAIAEAVPNAGIVAYIQDPAVTGEMIARLADASPNFVGVKYAVPDPNRFATIVAGVGSDRLAWICGLAESWAPFFWIGGARGFTSGLVNIEPTLSLTMLRCLRTGDFAGAMRVWSLVKPFEDLRARHNNANNVPAVKEAMAQLGLCERTVRPPISVLSEAERAEIAAILAQWATAHR